MVTFRKTGLAAAALAMALAGTPCALAGDAPGMPTQAVGPGELPHGRTVGVEHVFATGPFAMHVLVRRGGRVDMLAFRDPDPRAVADVPEGGECWADEAADGKVTFHLRTLGQVG